MIEAQIDGDPELDFTDGHAPWLSWGPYLWADGTTARDDGLVWECSDFREDGTHPSESGRQKVAAMLLNFFESDTTARPWFVAPPANQPAQPVVMATVNAASYGSEVAAGSIVTLFGSELSSTTASAQGVPLPTVLGSTMVRIGGEAALLYYVSPDQINLVVPKAPADAEVVVLREDLESDPLSLSLTMYAPGVFTLDGMPGGPAAGLHADGRIVGPADPAARGETIQLFLTGMGVRNPLMLRPDVLPVVRVGDVPAEIAFSGDAPGYPGLDQINFKVPLDAPAGPEVPLTVQFGSSVGNRVTLAVGQ
jgi:uncharacterized protein (TIGR03437 family)